MKTGALVRKAAEDDAPQRRRRRQHVHRRLEGDASGPLGRKPKGAGRNGGKCHRTKTAGVAELDGAAIAAGEQFIFAAVAAVPDWSDGMNHVARGEQIAFGDLGVAGFAAIESATLGKKPGTRRIMDGTVNAATAKQRRICRVDDGVNAQGRDVGNSDFELRRADGQRRQAQAEACAPTGTPFSASSCCSSPAWNISRMISQPPTNSPLT
jgi:hypothetical protein